MGDENWHHFALRHSTLGLGNYDGDAGVFFGSRKGLVMMEVWKEATNQSAGV